MGAQPLHLGLTDDQAPSALQEARQRTLALVHSVSDEDLERVHSPLMSPLVWDLGHIAAFEDLWIVHRYGGRPLLHEELADVYDAFETPRAGRGELPFLGPAQAREYLAEVRERSLDVIEGAGRRRRRDRRADHAPRAAAQRDDAADDPAGAVPRLRARGATRDSRPASRRAWRGPPHRARADRGPGRRVHDRRRRRPLRLRQRATPPPHRRAPLPDRLGPDHQCHLPDVRRGRRLRATRVVV